MTAEQLPLTAAPRARVRDDRVLPEIRVVAVFVLFMLLLAVATLYVVPDATFQNWAWTLKRHIDGFAIGSGYLMGMYFFVRVLFVKRWHLIAAGFWPITSFTFSMLLATIVHWDRFNTNTLSYFLWVVIYIITPVLVPLLWWRNRMTDPGASSTDEIQVPLLIRRIFGLGGAGMLLLSIICFLFPDLLINTFAWPLNDFSARLLAGWMSIPGVGGITLALEPRWSGWRILLQAAYFGLVCFVLAVPRAWGDLILSRPFTWAMLVGLLGILVISPLFYVWMGRRRPARAAG